MAETKPSERERFSREEAVEVLVHYAVGSVAEARVLTRGRQTSPKLLVTTDRARYLLKRRAPGRDRAPRVQFSHALMAHLLEKRFPVPKLIATREGETSLALHGRVYELFEFVDAEPYDESLEETYAAGRTLARFHRAVTDFQSLWEPPGTGFHASPSVRGGLNAIPSSVSGHDSVMGREAELLSMTQELYERYDAAAQVVRDCGYGNWRMWVVHGDWHPGNLLFRDGRVAAVVDFDAARRQPPVADLANGMLHFSLLRGGDDPSEWPEFFDRPRMRRFFRGYTSRARLADAQRRALPHLMIESLIAEAVVPIAATGSLGQIPGFGVLQMVRRKVHWLLRHFGELEQWLLE